MRQSNAAAVQPVYAQTILTVGEVKIPVKDRLMPAYRAMPSGGKKLPVVLVVQEILGVHEYNKDVCRRFAKEGYLAIATELYARQGDATKYEDVAELLKEIVSNVPDAQVMSDLDASAAWAGKNGGNGDKMAATGFCRGGRVVWINAAVVSSTRGE